MNRQSRTSYLSFFGLAIAGTLLLAGCGGGSSKKGGGGGGGARFSIPDAGRGIYTLTVTDMTKDGYAFDACNGELSTSVYL